MPKSKSPAKVKAETPSTNGVEPAERAATAASPKQETSAISAGGQDHTTSVSKYLLSTSQKNEDEADAKLSPFLREQKKRLLALRDAMLDSMNGVAQDNLRARAESNEASAFGMHQADAGSDAYDRDFALNLLSQEQDALYEIDEALKRIELGTYGTCEMSGKPINNERLEAIPFARLHGGMPVADRAPEQGTTGAPVGDFSLFGLTEEENNDTEEEEFTPDTKE